MNHDLMRAQIADFDRQARRDAIAASARQGRRAPTRPQHTILTGIAGRLRQHILARLVTLKRDAEDRTCEPGWDHVPEQNDVFHGSCAVLDVDELIETDASPARQVAGRVGSANSIR
jgi:hypothetical protein